MTYNESKLVVDEDKLLGIQEGITITKKDFIANLKSVYEKGGEISWLSTDYISFEWSEINDNSKKFLKNLSVLDFDIVDVGIFYPETKETEYTTYKIQ